MILQLNELRDKLAGCWTGKNVGGVLGAPFECKRMIPDVDFYVQDLTQGPPANDDLDLQIVWLAAVERYGRNVNASILGEYWLSFVIPNWVEYGTGKTNLRAGLVPPLSGDVDNTYKNSNGCWIRSELWACLAPGDPELAVRIATEDACVDHSGDGISAIRFLAAIESAAFAENDLNKLIETGMRYLPEGERMKNAFKDTIAWWNETEDYIRVREKILKKYSVENWTDVTINLSFILLALLNCENSFDKAICHAVNMGHDADWRYGRRAFRYYKSGRHRRALDKADRKFACAFLQYDKYDRLGFNR